MSGFRAKFILLAAFVSFPVFCGTGSLLVHKGKEILKPSTPSSARTALPESGAEDSSPAQMNAAMLDLLLKTPESRGELIQYLKRPSDQIDSALVGRIFRELLNEYAPNVLGNGEIADWLPTKDPAVQKQFIEYAKGVLKSQEANKKAPVAGAGGSSAPGSSIAGVKTDAKTDNGFQQGGAKTEGGGSQSALHQKILGLIRSLSAADAPSTFDPSQPYTPGSNKYRDTVREIAKGYALLHEEQRSKQGRDKILYGGVLSGMVEKTRKGGHGGGIAERVWEYELSSAMNERADGTTHDEMMNAALKNVDGRSIGAKRKLPNIAGADSIGAQWDFAGLALETMATVEIMAAKVACGKNPTEEEWKSFSDAMTKWYDNKFVKLRPREGDADVKRQLSAADNQNVKWGKAFSLELMRTIAKNPALRSKLPPDVATNFDAVQKSTGESLGRNVKEAQGDPQRAWGVGGSNMHGALFFYAISVLPDDIQKECGAKMVQTVEKNNGGKVGWVGYYPLQQLPSNESERSSAGRAVPYYLFKYNIDPTDENRKQLVTALENFAIYSGSLRAEVPRAGVHGGPDQLAPYYFHPGINAAGVAIDRIRKEMENSQDADLKRRFDHATQMIEAVARSTWDKKTDTYLVPGDETYQSFKDVFPNMGIAALAKIHQSDKCEPGTPSTPDVPKGPDTPPTPEPQRDIASNSFEELQKSVPQAGTSAEAFEKFGAKLRAWMKAHPNDFNTVSELLENLGVKRGDERRGLLLAMALQNHAGRVTSSEVGSLMEITRSPESAPVALKNADSALQSLRSRGDLKGWTDFLAGIHPLRDTKDDALFQALWRMELLSSDDASDHQAVYEKLANERMSLTAAKREAIKKQLEQLGDDPRSKALRAAMLQLYGAEVDPKAVVSKELLDRAKDAARARAREWNEQLKSVFNSDGTINLNKPITITNANGEKETISVKQWISNQREAYGEDQLLRWAAEVGGDSGERTLRALFEGKDAAIKVGVSGGSPGQSPKLGSYSIADGDRIKVGGSSAIRDLQGILSQLADTGGRAHLSTDSSGSETGSEFVWNGRDVARGGRTPASDGRKEDPKRVPIPNRDKAPDRKPANDSPYEPAPPDPDPEGGVKGMLGKGKQIRIAGPTAQLTKMKSSSKRKSKWAKRRRF